MGGLAVSFFAPVAGIILTAILLGIVDFIIKVSAVYKKEGLGSITSSKMRDTIQKLILYAVLIILMHIIDIVFLQELKINLFNHILNKETIESLDKIKLSAIVAFVIAIREIKSIDENWKYALGWSFLETIENMLTKLKNINKNARKRTVNQAPDEQP